MKICWDSLEKLKYIKDKNLWYNGKTSYRYVECCRTCGDDFLASTLNNGYFCCRSCFRLNDEAKHKISLSLIGTKRRLGKKHSDKTKEILRAKSRGRKCHWMGGVVEKNLPLYNTYASKLSYCEEVRRSSADNNILEVRCFKCRNWFVPKRTSVRLRLSALSGQTGGESHFYCSQDCKIQCSIFRKRKYSDDEILKRKELYHSSVDSISNHNYLKYLWVINPLGLVRGTKSEDYSLDHIYSIQDGFENSILPEIISSPVNLRMITLGKNISKSNKSLFTKEQLYELYYQFLKEEKERSYAERK